MNYPAASSGEFNPIGIKISGTKIVFLLTMKEVSMPMKQVKKFCAATVVLAVMMHVSGLARAAPILDQEYDPASIDRLLGIGEVSGLADPDIDTAQTFTVGLTGTLASVEVLIRLDSSSITADLVLDVRTTAGGVPTEPDAGANILGTVSILANSIPTTSNFFSVDLSSLAIAVTTGDVLAIVLQSSGPNPAYLWSGTSADGYAGGATYRRFLSLDPTWATTGAASDLAFRTFVDVSQVPEPTTLLLMGIGLAGVGFARRRRLA